MRRRLRSSSVFRSVFTGNLTPSTSQVKKPQRVGLFLCHLHPRESQNHFGWKRPLKLSPAVSLTPPWPLDHILKCHVPTVFYHLQEWWLHFPGQAVPISDSSDYSESRNSDHERYNGKCVGTGNIPHTFCGPWAVKPVTCSKVIASKDRDSSTSFSPGHLQSNWLFWFPYNLWLWCLCGGKLLRGTGDSACPSLSTSMKECLSVDPPVLSNWR